ncbi:transport and Golgi organization protein 6 homolog isoform X2 [Palaemon carinicauda]|uniref:transport and Golgi organization protein 6 homolog isoform X2 n=1 Tax=Palaemon carinicauda TaxID=392227 RepID=UPI0035B6836A
MTRELLFKWLEPLSKLGMPGTNSLEHAKNILSSLKEEGFEFSKPSKPSHDDTVAEKELRKSIQSLVVKLLSNVDDATKSDVRVVCGCYVIAVLYEIHKDLSNLSSPVAEAGEKESSLKAVDNPPPPPSLISVQQTKIVEDALRLVNYTIVLGCLSLEASQYIKVMVARRKFVFGPNLVTITPSCRHIFLASLMKIILDFYENPSLGSSLRGSLFPEMITVLLELCFAPGKVKDHPEDTAYFRERLEKLLSAMDANQTLQHLLLLKGIAKNGGWLQKVCGSFIVRRYMMQPNGVAAVIGAGLIVCDGKDWKHCEAVAGLISHAKYPNIDEFYSTVGPQISALMMEQGLKPEILRVVMVVVSQLAERSATLTALHVTKDLLQPLMDTINHSMTSQMTNCSLTLCVGRIHKLFVEIASPSASASLMGLLKPLIDPLVAVAAFPASYLRNLAKQCVTRFMTQQSSEEVIRILLHVCRVNLLPEFPTINPNVSFCLDDEGGLKVDVKSVCQQKVLEDDENLAKVVVQILEELKNPEIVRTFYESLVSYIDFRILNKKETSSTILESDCDIRDKQFEAIRRIYISCSLLSNLAENEKLTNDLFQNLSAAVPIVVTLLKTCCQTCEDDALDKTRLSFMLHVIMMVSCYVNEQISRKKMSSEDWKGLKLLLPSLEEIKNSVSDEAVLLFVEQLRNAVVTHGVITTATIENNQTLEKDKNEQQQHAPVRESSEVDKSSNSSRGVSCVSNKTSVKSTCKTENNTVNMEKLQNDSGSDKNTEEKSYKSSYSAAMEDVVSHMLPIRGHGLLALSKLVEERDSETISHKEQLLALFQHGLKEEDSYLYLNAIQGLAVLCDAFPEKVVGILTQEFAAGNRSPEDRAKLAETLARASKRLGPILPHYKPQFINCLLSGIRDSEPIVRASSLSSLGDVCKILRFSLGSIMFEVFEVLQGVIDTDNAVEVRRAAVLVVTLILQGLGRDAFLVLKDVIRNLYRVLRLVQTRDPDDIVRLHAQLAIEEIDSITREFLLPKLNLTKRMYVADIPPKEFF